jgi:hypothetical protein
MLDLLWCLNEPDARVVGILRRQPPGQRGYPAAAYDARYRALMDEANPRLSALIPDDADPGEVADVIAGIVGPASRAAALPRPRDPSRDGSEVVSAVADRIRADFYRRIGLDDLLARSSR